MNKPKYSIRKYDGDDCLSYAVFHKQVLKGLPRGGPIFFGQAIPIACGLSRYEALSMKVRLELGDRTGDH